MEGYVMHKRSEAYAVLDGNQLMIYSRYSKRLGAPIDIRAVAHLRGAAVNKVVGHRGVRHGLEIVSESGVSTLIDLLDPTVCSSWYGACHKAKALHLEQAKANQVPIECRKILGFDADTKLSKNIIARAYKKLSLKAHPDKGGNPEEFAAICAAYTTLIEIQEVSDERESTKTVEYEAIIEKQPSTGLGLNVTEDKLRGQVLVQTVSQDMSLHGLSPEAEGEIRPGDALVAIDVDDCSQWPLSRIRTRLANVRVPVGSTVRFTLERRVPLDWDGPKDGEEPESPQTPLPPRSSSSSSAGAGGSFSPPASGPIFVDGPPSASASSPSPSQQQQQQQQQEQEQEEQQHTSFSPSRSGRGRGEEEREREWQGGRSGGEESGSSFASSQPRPSSPSPYTPAAGARSSQQAAQRRTSFGPSPSSPPYPSPASASASFRAAQRQSRSPSPSSPSPPSGQWQGAGTGAGGAGRMSASPRPLSADQASQGQGQGQRPGPGSGPGGQAGHWAAALSSRLDESQQMVSSLQSKLDAKGKREEALCLEISQLSSALALLESDIANPSGPSGPWASRLAQTQQILASAQAERRALASHVTALRYALHLAEEAAVTRMHDGIRGSFTAAAAKQRHDEQRAVEARARAAHQQLASVLAR